MKSVKEIIDSYPSVAITGTRHSTVVPPIAYDIADHLATRKTPIFVGDAKGIDSVFISRVQDKHTFYAKSKKAVHLVQRSTLMIKTAATHGSILVAFPASHCPAQIVPSRRFEGHGSGSWGSIALAIFYRMPVLVYYPDYSPGTYTPAPFKQLGDWLLFMPSPTLL